MQIKVILGKLNLEDKIRSKLSKSKRKTMEASHLNENEIEAITRTSSSKEELDLLLARDNEEENAKDSHIRSIQCIEKKKSVTKMSSRITEDEVGMINDGMRVAGSICPTL